MSVRLRSFGELWRLDWADREGAARRFEGRDAAMKFLSRWRGDATAMTALRSLLARRVDTLGALTDEEVLRRCVDELAWGRLCAWPVKVLRVDDVARSESDAEAETETVAQGALHEEKTWIEIELTDMEGNPRPGERYWIKLTDESVREGALDRLGRAYFGGLDAGVCEIRWPELDEEAVVEVNRATSAPTESVVAKKKKDWIEIELTDMAGAPVAGERYWIKLTDGAVREGRLDASGRAYFAEIDSGVCEIRWPERDEEATVPESETVTVARRPSRQLSWIEFELVAMDGTPVEGERFRAKGPDGVERNGRSDARGVVRFDGVDEGEFELVWVDRDEECIEEVVGE